MDSHAAKVVGVCLADWTSVVLIVLCNKLLMSSPVNFKFPVTLTAAHFTVTGIISNWVKHGASSKSHLSVPNSESHDSDPPLSHANTAVFVLVSAAAVITVNASLLLNSVAFYQVIKMLTLPFVAIVESWMGSKQYGFQHLAGFGAILVGVSLTIDGDLSTSYGGLCMAASSVMFAGASQLACGHLQSHHSLSPSTLLSIVSPYKACLLWAVGPCLDRYFFSKMWVTEYAWTPRAAQLLALSCVLALCVNFLQYTAISLLGPGIYSALGQVKTAGLVVLGSLVFQGGVSFQQMIGTALAVSAVWWLAWLESASARIELDDTSTQELQPALAPTPKPS